MMKRRILSLLLALALLCAMLPRTAIPTFAATNSGSCGPNLTWRFDAGTGTLTIEGSGEMDDYLYGQPWYIHTESIKQIVFPSGLTSIGGGAFYRCTGLTSVTLPDGLTSIGNSAFYGCTGLTSVTLPDELASIGNSAFYGCTGLTSVSFPNGLSFIGGGAFYDCIGLTSVILPDGLTSIGDWAFRNCTALTSVSFPAGLTSIGNSAFYGCTGLTSVTLPDGLTSIGNSAFDSCTGLTSVTFPDGLTSIGDYAFYYCTALTSVTFPAGLNSIGSRAFRYCDALSEISIPATVSTIGSYAFDRLMTWGTFIPTKVFVLARNAEIQEEAFGSGGTSVIYGYGNSTAQSIAVLDGNLFVDLETGEIRNSTSNRDRQEYSYSRWSSVVRSYLYEDGNNHLTRVEFVESLGSVLIEVYGADHQRTASMKLDAELPLFGGFYCGADYNFLIFGQKNPDESNDVEVIRVVRYTKDWQRVDHASLFGANTTIPFNAGSLRTTEHEGYLYVNTSHQMYKSSDGRNHQASLSLCIRISDMTVSDHVSTIGGFGYCSHSFNQFVHYDGDTLLFVNHGDAYPRAVVISRCQPSAGQIRNYATARSVSVFSITGEIGNNDTGVSLGGFECSSNNYLIAGNSILQDGTVSLFGQRNIFLTVTKKSDFTEHGTTLKWITSFENKSSEDVKVSTPHLVKYSDDCFLLMWTEDNVLRHCFLDGSGNQITETYSDENARISDCKPIVKDDKIVWYVTEAGFPLTFYEIDPSDPSVINSFHEHVYENGGALPTCTSDGHVVYTCLFCDDSYETDEPALGHDPGEAVQKNFVKATCTTGAGYDWVTRCQRCGEILTSEHVETAPPLGHDFGAWQNRTAPTCTEPGEDYRVCNRCIAEDTRSVDALGHNPGQPAQENVVNPTCTEAGGYDMVTRCQRCNDILDSTHYTTDALGHSFGAWKTRQVLTCTQDGIEYRVCSRCNKEETRTEEAPGHNPGQPAQENVVNPTCTKAGSYDLVTRCQRCNAVLENIHYTTDALGHSFGAWKTRQTLTCTQDGIEYRVCSRCNKEETRTEHAPGHDWDEGAVTVKPSAEADGVRTYTCRRCGETKTEAISNNPFADVKKSKYYYKAVLWAYYHDPQITNGTDATHFSPNDTCTRAQVVTFLYAAKGKPEADWSNNPFVDVKKSKYYFKPVLWAYQNSITNGTDATHFNPNGECTRAQVVTFLWALSGKPNPAEGSNPFKDVKKSNWYYKAVLWAYQNGITSGVDATHFGPNQTCTRGQVVTFLYALLGK